jgi:hypothetical protein
VECDPLAAPYVFGMLSVTVRLTTTRLSQTGCRIEFPRPTLLRLAVYVPVVKAHLGGFDSRFTIKFVFVYVPGSLAVITMVRSGGFTRFHHVVKGWCVVFVSHKGVPTT